jgi:hypothetical protein
LTKGLVFTCQTFYFNEVQFLKVHSESRAVKRPGENGPEDYFNHNTQKGVVKNKRLLIRKKQHKKTALLYFSKAVLYGSTGNTIV